MKKIALLLAAVCVSNHALAADWKPVPGHIMTRWAKDVSPDKVLPEYPRPQLVRPRWQNLNGLWDCRITKLGDPAPTEYSGKILVPFCIESALSGVRQPLSAQQELWYRRTFAAPELGGGKRLLLHFGAVDWKATVIVNGKKIGQHTGGYDAFSFDLTEAVKPGDNELVVCVFDATRGAQARGKQFPPRMNKPSGITYSPCSGIWQTVWLETVPAAYIQSLKIVPDIDAGAVEVTVNVAGANSKVLVQATALDNGKVVAEGRGSQNQPFRLPIPNARLWSPEQPLLYDLKVKYLDDEVQSYFGMRKIALGKDEKGTTRIFFNNKPLFMAGFLDQGYWPDGIYTAPTDEALRWDIEFTKRIGMNTARKHVKVEPARWYYWCDKLGLIVWQDMPCAGPIHRDGAVGQGAGRNQQTGQMIDGKPVSAEGAEQFERELKAMVEGLRNHPSIVMWIVFNEGWGQYDTPRLTNWVKSLDPSRLASNASGGHDVPAGDVMDAHLYPGPFAPKPTDGRASVCGEFGGLALPIPGHTWVEKSWGYRRLNTKEDLAERYVGLIKRAYELRDSEAMCAFIYTQTTDVETECNGLVTYDREVIKLDVEKTAAANRGQFPPGK